MLRAIFETTYIDQLFEKKRTIDYIVSDNSIKQTIETGVGSMHEGG